MDVWFKYWFFGDVKKTSTETDPLRKSSAPLAEPKKNTLLSEATKAREDLKKLSYSKVMALYEKSQPKRALQGVQQSLEGLKNDLQGLQQMPEWLQDSLKGANHSQDLHDQLAGVETHVKGLQDDLAGLQMHLGGLTEHIGGIQKEMPGLQRHLPSLEHHASKMSKQMGGLQEHLGGMQRHLPELQKHLRLVEAVLWHFTQNKESSLGLQGKDVNAFRQSEEGHDGPASPSGVPKSKQEQKSIQDKETPQRSAQFGGVNDIRKKEPSRTWQELAYQEPKMVSCHILSTRSDAFDMTEQKFMRTLKGQLLQQANIDITFNKWKGGSTQIKYVLVLCLKISRLGTDVDHLRRDINLSKKQSRSNIVLVTFHHIAQHIGMGVSSRDQLPEESRRAFNAIFDARCWSEAGGFYDCHENIQVIQDVARHISYNWPPDGATN